MRKIDKNDNELENNGELEKLYEIYLRVQSGDKSALNDLFKERNTDNKHVCKADVLYKKSRLSNMDNVLDSELVLENEKENEKNKQTEEWLNSDDSKVIFKFSCLNGLLFKEKKVFLSKAKNTGYENGKKNNGHSKFYEGEYDVSDFNELMYMTIIEIFNEKTDENNCLTLDGKKNVKVPICDGVSLLKNISYFTSRKINKRAKSSHLDIVDVGMYGEESDDEFSIFDKYALEEFLASEGGTSRLEMYAEYLEWLKRNDIHNLFKVTSRDIKAIIETIMNCNDTFITEKMDGDIKTGLGMRFVKQETLQEIIKSRHNINIEQTNIAKDLKFIEQRLLDHLLYSLNYKISKAKKSNGIYGKESERFLYELDKKAYIKIFSRASYEVYDKSIGYIDSGDFDSYLKILRKYEDMIIDIVSLEKGKKKYDMVNLILENDDLVDNKEEALFNMASTLIAYYQKTEEDYKKNDLGDYKIKGLADWRKGYWRAELESEILKIKLLSSKDIKNPVRYNINKENLLVYCGYMNFYFCDRGDKTCYSVPKDRRIISRSNKNHEIFIYNAS